MILLVARGRNGRLHMEGKIQYAIIRNSYDGEVLPLMEVQEQRLRIQGEIFHAKYPFISSIISRDNTNIIL